MTKTGLPLLKKLLHNTKRILRNKDVLVITTALPTSIKESLWFTQLHQPVTNQRVFFRRLASGLGCSNAGLSVSLP